MKRRHSLRAFLIALFALQSMVLAPAAMALHGSIAGAMPDDCSSRQGAMNGDCPCCPPGISTVASCAAHCLGTSTTAPAAIELAGQSPELTVFDFVLTQFANQIYSPLDRPPIG